MARALIATFAAIAVALGSLAITPASADPPAGVDAALREVDRAYDAVSAAVEQPGLLPNRYEIRKDIATVRQSVGALQPRVENTATGPRLPDSPANREAMLSIDQASRNTTALLVATGDQLPSARDIAALAETARQAVLNLQRLATGFVLPAPDITELARTVDRQYDMLKRFLAERLPLPRMQSAPIDDIEQLQRNLNALVRRVQNMAGDVRVPNLPVQEVLQLLQSLGQQVQRAINDAARNLPSPGDIQALAATALRNLVNLVEAVARLLPPPPSPGEILRIVDDRYDYVKQVLVYVLSLAPSPPPPGDIQRDVAQLQRNIVALANRLNDTAHDTADPAIRNTLLLSDQLAQYVAFKIEQLRPTANQLASNALTLAAQTAEYAVNSIAYVERTLDGTIQNTVPALLRDADRQIAYIQSQVPTQRDLEYLVYRTGAVLQHTAEGLVQTLVGTAAPVFGPANDAIITTQRLIDDLVRFTQDPQVPGEVTRAVNDLVNLLYGLQYEVLRQAGFVADTAGGLAGYAVAQVQAGVQALSQYVPTPEALVAFAQSAVYLVCAEPISVQSCVDQLGVLPDLSSFRAPDGPPQPTTPPQVSTPNVVPCPQNPAGACLAFVMERGDSTDPRVAALKTTLQSDAPDRANSYIDTYTQLWPRKITELARATVRDGVQKGAQSTAGNSGDAQNDTMTKQLVYGYCSSVCVYTGSLNLRMTTTLQSYRWITAGELRGPKESPFFVQLGECEVTMEDRYWGDRQVAQLPTCGAAANFDATTVRAIETGGANVEATASDGYHASYHFRVDPEGLQPPFDVRARSVSARRTSLTYPTFRRY